MERRSVRALVCVCVCVCVRAEADHQANAPSATPGSAEAGSDGSGQATEGSAFFAPRNTIVARAPRR